MNLYLVQHGLSLSKEEDPRRSLSQAGEAEVRRIARFASTVRGLTVERILHSGKERAMQTAEILAAALGKSKPAAVDGLAPLDDPEIWAGRLDSETEDTMLVGHLPHLDRLASLRLAGDQDRSVIRFANAGITALVKDPEKGWQVAWIITPGIVG